MYIYTEIDTYHRSLIHTFILANELDGIYVEESSTEIRGNYHKVLALRCESEDSQIKLTFMGLRHSGILNMLDDYLLKCGIKWDALKPASYMRQLQNEKEYVQNEKFLEHIYSKIQS